MFDETKARQASGAHSGRWTPPWPAVAGAALLLLTACGSADPEIIPAMAPAPASECEVEWPDDPAAAPVLACSDGTRRTIRPGSSMVIGDPALSETLP